MKILHLECKRGVSGDMLLAALLDMARDQQGPDLPWLQNALTPLHLEFDIQGFTHKVSSIKTARIEITPKTDQPLRTLPEITSILNGADIPDQVRTQALQAFKLLGQAEANVHDMPLEKVHFHEIGAVDTMVDIVGVLLLVDALNVDQVHATPVDLGSGYVHMAHGIFPVPAPACAELAKNMPVFASNIGMETATPTGLTLLKLLVDHWGELPAGRVQAVGYGSGARSNDQFPTFLRAFIVQQSVTHQPADHAHTHL
jgi:uncharacterized protein (DUF111 family)